MLLNKKITDMKTIITIIISTVAVSCFAQKNTSQLFSYLYKPADVNSCYQATPQLAVTVKKEQSLLVSTNNGTTWDDFTLSLPPNIQIGTTYVKNGGMYLGTADGKMYYNNNVPNSNWELQTIEGKTSEYGITVIAEGKSAMYATVYHEGIYKKVNGTNIWKPIHNELEDKTFYGVIETADGAILVGNNSGIFRTENEGKTWEHVYTKSWAHTFVSGSGILFANNSQGLLRSTDEGKTWEVSLNDEGGYYKTKYIDGYFVAMRIAGTWRTGTKDNQWVNISKDGGNTWQLMNTGNPADTNINDLNKIGDYLISARKTGVSRSKDLGKTWQLLLTPEDNKGMMQFELQQSGDTIFAIIKMGGC